MTRLKGLQQILVLIMLMMSWQWTLANDDLSYSSDKIVSLLSQEQLKAVDTLLSNQFRQRSLDLSEDPEIKRTIDLKTRALIKSKTLGNSLFEHVVQKYPDILAFNIVYRLVKNVVVIPTLIYHRQFEVLAALMILPDEHISYFSYKFFINWAHEVRMRNKFKLSLTERDRILADLLGVDDYKKLQIHVLKNEAELVALPVYNKKTSKAKNESYLSIEDLEKIINDPQFIKDLKLATPDPVIYQNILLQSIFSASESRDQFWKRLPKALSFTSESTQLVSELLRLQKSIQLMSVKFVSLNVLSLLKKNSREHFLKQNQVFTHLSRQVNELEMMKWRLASRLKRNLSTAEEVIDYRSRVRTIENETNTFLATHTQFSKISFCPATFAF
jgi:hypothetical protein